MAESTQAAAHCAFRLRDVAATAALAGALAGRARRRDVIALRGALGAGKTEFARAFIRARQALGKGDGDEVAEVPSPTFTLVQVYELANAPVWHFDLYRLARPEDAWELGIEDAFADAISLIEWPDRLGDLLPAMRLDVELSPSDTADAREVTLTGHGDWAGRLAGFADG